MGDKFDQTENITDINDTNEKDINHESDLDSDHSHHSHHSYHSHHSHHSHHSSKRSSHHKNHSNKGSLLKRTQEWIDKNVSTKRLVMISLLVILVALGIIFYVETVIPSNSTKLDEDQVLNYYDETGVSSYSSVASVTVPSYWKETVKEKIETVQKLQVEGGKDCVSFVWASDTHIPDNYTARTNDIGKIMAKILDDCEIPFSVITGDIGTRISYDTEEELLNSLVSVPIHLAPLWGTDRLLLALGNHDGCYGDSNGYYKKQFSPEKLWQTYFRGQALDFRRVFSDDGLYFYVDNVSQKTRFIMLNSQFGGEYSIDGNGRAVNDRFAVSCYGQEQLDWLANEALDMPEGYGALIMTHVPPKPVNGATDPYTVDYSQLNGIINAYCNKTTFNVSYTAGVDGWSNSTISVDFTEAKGEIIAMFAGHIHWDTVDTETLACPLITIISAGASVNGVSLGEGEVAPTRTFGTDTETSLDVVTINRKTRTIYCTRVGAGEDRVINY